MELIKKDQVEIFNNSGILSHQLLFPENSSSKRITMTRVVIPVGVISPLHNHEESEQIWHVISGSAKVLLANEEYLELKAGDTIRFEEGEYHGVENTGDDIFEYLSVTSPPLNFRKAYERSWTHNETT